MMHEPLSELIAGADAPAMLSGDGQSLSLMAKLLVDIHTLSPRCLYLLEAVYNETEKLKLRDRDVRDLILPHDAWRSFLARFIDNRYAGFVNAVETWANSLPIIPPRRSDQPQNLAEPVVAAEYVGEVDANNAVDIPEVGSFTLCVLLMTVTDPAVPNRSADECLSESLLTAMRKFARHALSHNALEFSLTPLPRPPSFNPLIETVKDYKNRCALVIDQHVADTLKIYEQFGGVAFIRRQKEDKHVRALAYRLLYPHSPWEWVASRPEIALEVPATHEGAQNVARRIGFELPKARR